MDILRAQLEKDEIAHLISYTEVCTEYFAQVLRQSKVRTLLRQKEQQTCGRVPFHILPHVLESASVMESSNWKTSSYAQN